MARCLRTRRSRVRVMSGTPLFIDHSNDLPVAPVPTMCSDCRSARPTAQTFTSNRLEIRAKSKVADSARTLRFYSVDDDLGGSPVIGRQPAESRPQPA